MIASLGICINGCHTKIPHISKASPYLIQSYYFDLHPKGLVKQVVLIIIR